MGYNIAIRASNHVDYSIVIHIIMIVYILCDIFYLYLPIAAIGSEDHWGGYKRSDWLVQMAHLLCWWTHGPLGSQRQQRQSLQQSFVWQGVLSASHTCIHLVFLRSSSFLCFMLENTYGVIWNEWVVRLCVGQIQTYPHDYTSSTLFEIEWGSGCDLEIFQGSTHTRTHTYTYKHTAHTHIDDTHTH